MLAGVLLACAPALHLADDLPARFAPLTLTLTHTLVLGMLVPVMIGALFQLMPVVGGQTVYAARWMAPFIAPVSTLIAICLGIGFLMGRNSAFLVAGILAALMYGCACLALLQTGLRIVATDATTRTLRYIALALGMVILCGVTMAGSFSGWWRINFWHWLNLHVAWGLAGWIGTLVLAIATTVVPMFWQTRRAGKNWQRSLPFCLWLPLLLALYPGWQQAAILVLCMVLIGYLILAMHALWHARRRFDPAWILWLTACFSGLGACGLTAALILAADKIPQEWQVVFSWWVGVFALVGVAVLPVNAMLGKIIPFLVFLHLRRKTPMGQRVPTMQDVLPPARLRWQARTLLLALSLLLLLPFSPVILATLAGTAFAVSQAMLASYLLLALLRYHTELKQ